jgi:hypothetical protein
MGLSALVIVFTVVSALGRSPRSKSPATSDRIYRDGRAFLPGEPSGYGTTKAAMIVGHCSASRSGYRNSLSCLCG